MATDNPHRPYIQLLTKWQRLDGISWSKSAASFISARQKLRNAFTFGNLALTASLFAASCCLLVWPRGDWIDRLLVESLQQRFHRTEITSSLTGIIVLGHDSYRFSEAGRLARMYRYLKVVVSDSLDLSGALAELGGGIDPSRVILETKSQNTYQNAIYCAELVKPKAHQRWLLVTGALHMSRAMPISRILRALCRKIPDVSEACLATGLPGVHSGWTTDHSCLRTLE